jgi:hypothetical protein
LQILGKPLWTNNILPFDAHVSLDTPPTLLPAKALIIDAEDPGASKVWIGSTHFYTPSLDNTREL